jgi:hypothetical protein
MTYDVKADVGGKLAQLGGRLIDAAAKRFADEFFEKFAQMVGGAPVGAAVAAAPRREGWLRRLLRRWRLVRAEA